MKAMRYFALAIALTGALISGVACADLAPSKLAEATHAYDDGRYADAATLAEAAAKEAQARSDMRGQLDALHVLTQALWKQSNYVPAESNAQQAIALARAAGDRPALGRALIDLGDIQERRKNHTQAIATYKSALGVLKLPDDWEQAGRANQQLGDIYVAHGDFEEGIEAYRAALKGATLAGDPANISRANDYLGYVSRRLGDCEAATGYHRTSLKVAEKISGEDARARAEARANNHLGLCFEAMALDDAEAGDSPAASAKFAQAAAYERTAIAAALRAHDTFRVGYARRALAMILREASEQMTSEQMTSESESGEARAKLLHESLEQASTALDEANRMNEPEWQGLALHHMAVAEARLGKYEEARALLAKAAALWVKIEDRYSEGFSEMFLADEVEVPGQHDAQAVVHYDRAIALFTGVGVYDDISTALYRKGLALERMGDLAGAKQAYEQSIAALETLRSRLTLPEHQQAFFARRQKPYEALIRLLTNSYHSPSSKQDDKTSKQDGQTAFQVSEQARARALMDMMDRDRGQVRAGIDDATRERERDLHYRYVTLSQELLASRDAARAAELRDALDKLAAEYQGFENELRERYPKYAELRHPKPITAGEVQKHILQPGEVLIEYFVGEKESWAFVVTRHGLENIVPIPAGRAELAAKVAALRRPFELVKQTGSVAALNQFNLEAAHELYEKLFAPVMQYASNKDKLYIVPHGPLFYLPFELLVVESEKPGTAAKKQKPGVSPTLLGRFANATYLLETAPPVSYALSASLLDPRLVQRAADGRRGIHFLGFGNPVVEGEVAAKEEGRGVALSALPFAAEEVRQSGQYYAPASRAYVGAQASKGKFIADAPESRMVLLSTHGLLDEERPMQSALVFARPQGKAEYETLKTYEIFDIKLRARLVVLSACEAGLGKIMGGEGLIGFDRALLYAGASSIAVTLWSVEDQASSQLVVGLFRSLHREKAQPARALKEMKLALLRSKRKVGNREMSLANPYFWAPFILISGPVTD
jgi:CHAT domain-containing protein